MTPRFALHCGVGHYEPHNGPVVTVQSPWVWHIKYLIFNRQEFRVRKGFFVESSAIMRRWQISCFPKPIFKAFKPKCLLSQGCGAGWGKTRDKEEHAFSKSLCSQSTKPKVQAELSHHEDVYRNASWNGSGVKERISPGYTVMSTGLGRDTYSPSTGEKVRLSKIK